MAIPERPRWKSRLAAALRVVVPLAVIAWLIGQVDHQQFFQLTRQPLRWSLLLVGFGCSFLALCLSFCRWYWLVRCLELPFRLKDAFRLGFLGYLLNFVSIGSVGGDLFKAIFIAREHPGRRTLAVTSVIADRVVGMYGLLVWTALAMIVTRAELSSPELRAVQNITWGVAGASTLAFAFILSPGFTTSPLAEWITTWPIVGGILQNVITALRCYRRRLGTLLVMAALSITIHSLSAVAFFFMAQGLSPDAPTLSEHFVIVPLASVAGALPFTPAGLGTFELAMELLYRRVPARPTVPGVLVALVYRLVTIMSAAIGALVYWFSQHELRSTVASTTSQ